MVRGVLMMSAELADFVAEIEKYGLVEPGSMAGVVGEGAGGLGDLADELVRLGRLTEFQARRLLDGRGRELASGDYVILEPVAQGGMGEVFRARHRMMRRQVALKTIRSAWSDDPAMARRFRLEVEVLARLSHPNVVMAYDAYEADGRLILIMEFVEGVSLETMIHDGGPCRPTKLLFMPSRRPEPSKNSTRIVWSIATSSQQT